MLKKLLKYDFISIFKYWGLSAAGSFALSIIGGLCTIILYHDEIMPDILTGSAGVLLAISIFGICAFLALSTILIFTRFYKNFFSDEGYLTFTLPVKRSHLLNSKLISSVVMTYMSFLVLMLDTIIIDVIYPDRAGILEFWEEFFASLIRLFEKTFEVYGVFAIIYAIEIAILMIMFTVFPILLIFCCITFASVVAKKAKILAAVGFYYLVQCVIGVFMFFFMLFGGDSIYMLFSNASEEIYPTLFALMLFMLILIGATFLTILYTVQYWMLDRRLNLN